MQLQRITYRQEGVNQEICKAHGYSMHKEIDESGPSIPAGYMIQIIRTT